MPNKITWIQRNYGTQEKPDVDTISVYQCSCGRTQRAAHPESAKGISEEAASACGWDWQDYRGWTCPPCQCLFDTPEDDKQIPPPGGWRQDPPKNVLGSEGVWRGIP